MIFISILTINLSVVIVAQDFEFTMCFFAFDAWTGTGFKQVARDIFTNYIT